MTIDLHGPDMSSILKEAARLQEQVGAGKWGTALVELVGDGFRDPEAARVAFDALGVRQVAESPGPSTVTVEHSGPADCIWHGERPRLVSMLDLYMRVQCGQFYELAWHSMTSGLPYEVGDELSRLRMEHQREEAWPMAVTASWGIANSRVPDKARVAYDVWKLLGGGVEGRPLFHPEQVSAIEQ